MKKKIKIILFLAIVLVAVCGLSLYRSYHVLQTMEYTISSAKIAEPVKVVLIADLHDYEFGLDNEKLVESIRAEEPDLILMAGDMLNGYSENDAIPVRLVEQLAAEVPVYYSWGNHELDYIAAEHEDLRAYLETAGAVVLDEESVSINVNGNDLLIGGMYEYAFGYDGEGHMDKSEMEPERVAYLEEFQASEAYKIMMAHRPDSFVFGEAYDTWNIDLVVSGHNHGGQIIIPFLGGLYGGDQGFWPEYDFGEYHFDTVKNMIITRGLGSHKEKLPRFNNRPEIVVINLVHA